MAKKNRLVALAFAVVFCFVTVFSVFCIAAEVNHDCLGESCRICSVVEQCGTLLKTVSSSLVLLLFICWIAQSVVHMVQQQSTEQGAPSLVTMKTKLSN